MHKAITVHYPAENSPQQFDYVITLSALEEI